MYIELAPERIRARAPRTRFLRGVLAVLSGVAALTAVTAAAAPSRLALQTNDAETAPRPNILVFISDDMGWGQPGFNGGTEVTTPNMDRIADEGVRLTQFYAQPVCAPTRASLITGRYAWKTGSADNPDNRTDDGLLLDERTIAEALRDSSYATWLVGKWQAGHWGSERLPLQRGFDHHYGFYNGIIDSYKHVRPWRYWHEILDWHRNGRPVVESGYSTFLLAEEASQLIERHDGSRPFFLYVAFNAAHDPFQAPPEYIAQFSHLPYDLETRKQRAMVKAMDDAIGQVMDALERRGVLDETLVMFLNDNGGLSEAGGNSPYRGLKGSYLEGGIRVPAVMRWPSRITAGSASDALMHVADLFPTFAGLAGADTGAGLPLDGLDVWEAIANGADSPREEVVHSLDVIRVGDWKLLEEDGEFAKGNKSSPLQLYNIAEDPYETANLASSETARVAELRERLVYHRPFARAADPGAPIPGLDGIDPTDDRPVMFGAEENTAFGAAVETALTQRQAGNLGPGLLRIETLRDQVTMVYDETLDADSVPPADAFTVVVNPGYESAEVSGAGVSGREVVLTLADSVAGGATVGLTYEVPDTGALRDADGLEAVGVTWVTDEAEMAAFTVTAEPETIAEGESATLTVAISNAVTFSDNQAISLAVIGGTAAASDYSLQAAALTLAAGATSVTADIQALDDQEEEADETVIVAATHAGALIGSATVMIEDDDGSGSGTGSGSGSGSGGSGSGSSGGGSGGGGGSANRPPVVEREIPAQALEAGEVLKLDIRLNFYDRDQRALDYTVESADTSVATVEVDRNGVLTILGVARGVTTITVTAADRRDERVSQSFRVTVQGPALVALFPSASDPPGREGFVRVINRSGEAGEVSVEAIDDSGAVLGTVALSIAGGATAHFNSSDLENGNPEKGLSGGVGSGAGNWRLLLDSELEFEVLSYIRTGDGLLTAMHDVAPSVGGEYRVAIFNPGRNPHQVSGLRLVNPGNEDAEVTIEGTDDFGASSASEVSLGIPAGKSVTLTALQLETGGEGLTGALGEGMGKWRLRVRSDRPIVVMNLLESPTGHLTNLSTVPDQSRR